MMLDPSVREPLVAAIPKLRAFAISLGRDRERAEDLVQGALGRNNTGSFERGSNMDAWLCTILRNHFYSEWKRDRRAYRAINILADTEATGPQQIASVEYSELCAALARLRDALLPVAVSGLTYGEAAGLCGCPVGTVKSRVNWAWSELARLCRSTAQKISSRTPSPLLEAEDVCRRKLRFSVQMFVLLDEIDDQLDRVRRLARSSSAPSGSEMDGGNRDGRYRGRSLKP
jgi:RNA polymerase sigma-70 factor, ECF subfamily